MQGSGNTVTVSIISLVTVKNTGAREYLLSDHTRTKNGGQYLS